MGIRRPGSHHRWRDKPSSHQHFPSGTCPGPDHRGGGWSCHGFGDQGGAEGAAAERADHRRSDGRRHPQALASGRPFNLLTPSGGTPRQPISTYATPSNVSPNPQVRCTSPIPILDKAETRCEHNCKAWAYAQRHLREVTVKHVLSALLGAATLLGSAPCIAQTTLTIATVNNPDMIRMQALTNEFTAKNPDITVKWVNLEENVLRQRVTTDIATKGGQFDVLTIGTYEVPIWAKKNWLVPLDNLGPDYDTADLLPKIRDAVSVSGKLYAAPFYGESSMMMYRTDLFQKAGLTVPEKPTWDFVVDAAKKLTDKSAGVYGICLRGKAGWGENMAFLTAMSNSFGARWFDEKWQPQFDKPEWKKTLTTYVDLMKSAGPPGASSNGFNENLALFNSGKCAMWIDATVAASFVTNPKDSMVADKVGFALAPN